MANICAKINCIYIKLAFSIALFTSLPFFFNVNKDLMELLSVYISHIFFNILGAFAFPIPILDIDMTDKSPNVSPSTATLNPSL